MIRKILIAPDKFKGTLSATEAAEAIERGWLSANPEDDITKLPISDGGDGFGKLMGEIIGADRLDHKMVNGTSCHWWKDNKSGTAIIESAEMIGITKIYSDGNRNPMSVDSTNLGSLLNIFRQPSRKIAERIIIGIGGSATNDGGFGMAKQLQWEFRDKEGKEIKNWPELIHLGKITKPTPDRLPLNNLPSIVVAADVQNPLLGENGCTQVFGPQKGLLERDIPNSEAALTRLAEVWESQMGENAAILPGAGAAGGLGFGLHCFAGATIRSGFKVFAEATDLKSKLAENDIVITGEGALDRQTSMGKGVGELAKLARVNNSKCIGLAGQLDNDKELAALFNQCRALTKITSREEAEHNAAHWLEKLSAEIAKEF
ncbi:MAG: glycerate kinase [Verrucomicrobiota bacterium]|nr:glycerate kinase [Verrucomicrobiota bacterium]